MSSFLVNRFQLFTAYTTEINANDEIAFEQSIQIYINKPQVVNKWLAGSVSLEPFEIDLLKDFPKFHNFTFEFRQFISKSGKIFKNINYLIIKDYISDSIVVFYPLINYEELKESKFSSVSFIHAFQYQKKEKKLNLLINKTEDIPSSNEKFKLQLRWLIDNLMPKLQNWCLNVNKNDSNFDCAKLNTLTLYDNMVDDYSKLYQHLKEIYWSRFADKWYELTNTNPEKFIHEDVSIACYFILAWKHFGFEVKNFVDLGCGNGLLVYILNDQGFNGYGIDMRKRKIWSNEFYLKSDTKLIERTIDPQNDTYEDCDWLIGNHSDELSPWLPCIAYRTSQLTKTNCNIMLIPCCLFDFNAKYEIKRNNESRFDTYLNYLSDIFKSFSIKLYRDKLRIPSTRNVCLIGLSDFKKFDKDEHEILNGLNTNLSNTKFKARDLDLEKARSSRNCTKNVDSDLKIYMMKKVLDYLLNNENNECKFLEKFDGTKWNSGRLIDLNEIANLFDKTELSKLKQECGGIKTLLKNFDQLFIVESKDKLRIKNKISDNITNKKKIFIKTKDCVFDQYHPDGCLLPEKDCLFLHKK